MDASIQLAVLAGRIAGARRLTILTGAGVSAASGVPTFRGEEGLWKHHRPEDMATAAAFARDPVFAWQWYEWRRKAIGRCAPNPAHEVIARWSRRPGTVVVTQNVDDLHVRTGTANLVRLHGSIWELSCWDRCARGAQPWRDERVPLPELPPTCPGCGGHARPAVVWFGEALAESDLEGAVRATQCDVFLTVGTSSLVYPAAGLALEARMHGAYTAEINAETTPATEMVDLAVLGRAEVVLPELERLAAAAED